MSPAFRSGHRKATADVQIRDTLFDLESDATPAELTCVIELEPRRRRSQRWRSWGSTSTSGGSNAPTVAEGHGRPRRQTIERDALRKRSSSSHGEPSDCAAQLTEFQQNFGIRLRVMAVFDCVEEFAPDPAASTTTMPMLATPLPPWLFVLLSALMTRRAAGVQK